MPALENFPFLSSAEFKLACESLLIRLSVSSSGLEAALNEENGHCFLVIRKRIDSEFLETLHLSSGREEDVDDEGEDDDDKECLSKQALPTARVDYHIVLSPSYQVPVLYFQIIAGSSGAPLSVPLSDLYTFLVPHDSRSAIEMIGVMGGISQGDHPVLGLPYYFVHPCNTAAAMSEWEKEEEMKLGTYLGVWVGLFGGVVGLWVPCNG